MRSTVRRMLTPALFTAATVAAIGCQPAPTPPPPAPPMAYKPPAQRSAQLSNLAMESKTLDQRIAELPGRNAAEHRKAMSAALQSLSHSIYLAAGSTPSLSILNAISTIDHSVDVVGQGDLPGKRLAAAENEGIVAAIGALQELAAHPATPDESLKAALDDAQSKLNSLQMTEGPLHELDATQTLSSVANAVRILADDFSGKGSMAAMP